MVFVVKLRLVFYQQRAFHIIRRSIRRRGVKGNPEICRKELGQLSDVAFLLRQDMDAAQSAGERAQLGAELADLEAYLDDYRENARWLISEASVARYRAQANRLQPTASDAWFTDAVAGAMFEFLNGQLTPAGFALAVSEAQ